MFEQPAVTSEKDRSRTIMTLSGLAILAVIALIILVSSIARRPSQLELSFAGSQEFDSYSPSVVISNIDKRTGERITGKYALIICKVQNTGDKELIGLQLRATVIGTGGQLIGEKVVTPFQLATGTDDGRPELESDQFLVPGVLHFAYDQRVLSGNPLARALVDIADHNARRIRIKFL